MVCIHCGGETKVVNSRLQRRNNQVWRRRRCLNPDCGALFTSEESADYGSAWAVRNASGGLKPFSRDKLLLSLHGSLKHRPTALQDAGGLADTVIRRLAAAVTDGALESHAIISTTLVALNRFDKAAGVHYAAHHLKTP